MQLFKNRLSSVPTSQSCNQLPTIEKNNGIETAQQKQPQKLVTTLEASSASASRSNNPFLRESSSNDTLPLQDDNGQKEKKGGIELDLDENDDTIPNGGRPVSPIKLIRPSSAPLAYTEDSG